ncbi:RICIN domain-containing protein [Streptomyces sp. NPDC052396]|uniref:RICIN domain-containing protein n=1 Tax=Streptomyces sp. NPDC052396 TaxID=3365689 RepID=UPI0037CD204F
MLRKLTPALSALALGAVLAVPTPAAAAQGPDLRTRINENKCADIYNFDNSNGAPLVVWDCNGRDNQKWGGATRPWEIRSAWNGKCMTFVQDRNTDSGWPRMFDCNGGIMQQWIYDYSSETLCTKRKPWSCLMLPSGNTNNGHRLMVWPKHTPPDPVHRWYFH